MRKPYSDPVWNEWKKLVPIIHERAESSDGFIANYSGVNTREGYLTPYKGSPLFMGNFTAWRDRESAEAFTYSGMHGKLLKHKNKWFVPGFSAQVGWYSEPTKFDISLARLKLAEHYRRESQ